VLFDLDGCLVDSTEAITTCLNTTLASFGLPQRPVDELRWMIGPPLPDGMERLLAEANAPVEWRDEAIVRYRAHYREVSLTATRTIDGIPAVLEELADQAVMLVVTSKPRVFARPILATLGLDGHFRDVFGPDADSAAEPKTVTLARALESPYVTQLSAKTVNRSESMWMVGDRHHDIDAGKAHGVGTIGVTWGAGDRAELESAGADAIIDAPDELTRQFAVFSRARSAGQ
jgi:phosphoglycolate phosphatase